MAIPAASPAVALFIAEALLHSDAVSREDTVHEFEGCRYLLTREIDDPQAVALSFGSPIAASPEAVRAVASLYEPYALLTETAPGHDVTFKVSLQKLSCLGDVARCKAIGELASIRALLHGHSLREMLAQLRDESLRPGGKVMIPVPSGLEVAVAQHADGLEALVPVSIKNHQEQLYAAMLIQEMTGASRKPSMLKAPSCLHRRAEETATEGNKPALGSMLFMISRRHVASADQVEKLAWMLLSFPAHFSMCMKDFKRGLRWKVRRQAQHTMKLLEEAKYRFPAEAEPA